MDWKYENKPRLLSHLKGLAGLLQQFVLFLKELLE